MGFTLYVEIQRWANIKPTKNEHIVFVGYLLSRGATFPYFPYQQYNQRKINVCRLTYDHLFGGIEAFRKEHFELINGFSNKFFGWGGEDDDLFNR